MIHTYLFIDSSIYSSIYVYNIIYIYIYICTCTDDICIYIILYIIYHSTNLYRSHSIVGTTSMSASPGDFHGIVSDTLLSRPWTCRPAPVIALWCSLQATFMQRWKHKINKTKRWNWKNNLNLGQNKTKAKLKKINDLIQT